MKRTVDALKQRGFKVGGMVSQEVRENGARVGFEVKDIVSGKKGWLAQVNQENGPRIGKYRVNLVDLQEVGVGAIVEAVSSSDIVAIDEIGPMELFSTMFQKAVEAALESQKIVVVVAHWKAHHDLVIEAKYRQDAETFVVSAGNREDLPKALYEKITEALK